MKKIILATLLTLNSIAFANVNAIVSILPQETFLKAIGGDKVNISLMVKPGNSPHTYEPKPSQMIDISKADIYFSIGVEFEKVWLPKFTRQNKNMIISGMDKGIDKIHMEKHSHHEEKHNEHDHEAHGHHDDHHEHEQHNEEEYDGKDPHVWTSPNNVKVIAKNILNQLVKIDTKNKPYYEQNYNKFITHINNTDIEIKNILKQTPKGSKFMVFHPAWGYFAKQYNLEQLAIEVEGKSPKPKTIKHIIEEAREKKVKAIFTAPEFSSKVAKQIAKELKINVIKVSPLNPQWSKNLKNLAYAISNK